MLRATRVKLAAWPPLLERAPRLPRRAGGSLHPVRDSCSRQRLPAVNRTANLTRSADEHEKNHNGGEKDQAEQGDPQLRIPRLRGCVASNGAQHTQQDRQ